MSWISSVRRRDRAEAALDREVRFHVECLVDDLVAAGVPRREAGRRARLEFGGVEQVKEQCRDVRPGRWLEDVARDGRVAARQMRRSPTLTLVVVMSLALGIGANTAILGVANALFVRPMPGLTETDRLVWLSAVERPRATGRPILYPDAAEIEATGLFTGVSLSRAEALNLGSGSSPSRAYGEMVSANYFDVLGVTPALGRWFRPDEGRTPGTHPVVVLGYQTWQLTFSGSRAVIGTRIVVNRTDFTVVGVAPEGFAGPVMVDRTPQLWLPIMMHDVVTGARSAPLDTLDAMRFSAIGRLRPGVTIGQVCAALETVAARLASDGPSQRQVGFVAAPVRGGVPAADRGDAFPVTLIGFAVSGLVLMIACANVAGLMLGRAASRGHEIAIRVALGAGRGRLVRQLLTESLLVSVAAGMLGLLLSVWATRGLVAVVGVPFPIDVTPDWTMLAATLAVSAVAAMTFGLLPAYSTVHGRPASALGTAAVAGSSRRRARLQRAFVVAQVALSLVLLTSAGVLLRSLQSAERIERARDEPDRILAASFDLSAQGYPTARQQGLAAELVEAVRAMPQVEAASLAAFVPGRGDIYSPVAVDGAAARQARTLARVNYVWRDFFRAFGMPLVRGRDFDENDRPGAPLAAVVNEGFARQYWAGDEAIGKQLRLGSHGAAALTVVGVVGDGVRASDDQGVPEVFVARQQQPESVLPFALVVRTRGPAMSVVAPVRSAVQRLDATLPLFDVSTLREVLDERRTPIRAASTVLNVFGGLALLLASIGIYGLVAWVVERRQREIGVRMALGATPNGIVRMTLAEGLRLGLLGTAVGLLLAVATTRMLASMVTGAVAGDLVMFGGACGLSIGVVLVASFLPARRASLVHPSVVLRVE
jgi:predicted permease